MSGRDFYEEARLLSRRLSDEGLDDWADKFTDAIKRGFTATEILMALRWEAEQLVKADLPLTMRTRRRLESLLSGLEDVLAK